MVSNFALMDQITALNWVAENIMQFNGDPSRVTLFGRDTGAACISYLMESPIVPQGESAVCFLASLVGSLSNQNFRKILISLLVSAYVT